jgi:heme A synthase
MTSESRLSPFARYAWAVLACNVGVVLWGAFVRATGSGAGCGAHWPRCDGQVLPRPRSAEMFIELTHRLTSGVALLLVLAMLVWALRTYPKGHAARLGAGLSMFFMLTEAGVGAGIVLLEYVADDQRLARVGWMAVHLVNTFLLLGAITLTAWWASGGRPVRLKRQGALGWAVPVAALLTLFVGMTGAVTALGDTLFPKTEVGLALPPAAHMLERLRVVHPVVAILTSLFVVAVAHAAARLRPGRTTRRLATALTVLFAVQLAAGTINVVLLAPVWMQIVHLLLADAVWIALILTGAAALADGRERSMATERRPASSRQAAVAGD